MWQHNNLPPNATVKDRGTYISIPPYAFTACSRVTFYFPTQHLILSANATEDAMGRDGLQIGRMQPDF